METTIQTAIRNFLAKFFQNVELEDEQDIFALGFVNSLFAMQLVLFIEKEFSLKVEDEDLDIDNFRSIQAMATLIQGKTATVSSAHD
ncbi:MAG: phosphopantetheine-binding protein [Ktedonobacteraceae bacterium]